MDGPQLHGLGLASRLPRLLVVDDQPINIQALYQVFSGDHRVLMATQGEQALKLAADKQPDLVLLDVEMPGMGGHLVCRRLKAEEATRDIPVVFVTALSDEAAETLGLELRAVDFISKPINPKIVRARVKTQLTLKAQADLLRHWVDLDGLTGVRNRRYLDERLASEWGWAVRNGAPLSVVLIGGDFFKRFNDHYGHQLGDDGLCRVAAALRGVLKRPGDLLARYGGEAFVCLLPETPPAGALLLAHQLGETVAALRIEHATSDAAVCVTLSLGVSSKPAGGTGSAETLLLEADTQLDRAKAQGCNQALRRRAGLTRRARAATPIRARAAPGSAGPGSRRARPSRRPRPRARGRR